MTGAVVSSQKVREDKETRMALGQQDIPGLFENLRSVMCKQGLTRLETTKDPRHKGLENRFTGELDGI